MLAPYLKENRKRISELMRDVGRRRWFSAAMFLMEKRIRRGLAENARGRLLDIGSGDQPYGKILPEAVTRYDSLDVERRHPQQTYVTSAAKMDGVPDAEYDSAMSFSVLEHVPDPWQALRHIHRVLKPGGSLILTVPHLSRLHEEPHDYFRFTHYGLTRLLEDSGFEVIELERNGGMISFLAHQASTLLLCLCWRVPVLKQLAFVLNAGLLVLPVAWLDGILMKRSLAPLNYYAVARKK